MVEAADGSLPGLDRAGLVRSVRTPEFDGVTFHEVLCKSALNKLPESSSLPFRFTVNTFRGCSHACRYCFARPSHEYLDLDAGADFDSQVVVKLNVAAVLRKELRRRSWRRDVVALGTNTDPYQRAEGRYRLMPGVITTLAQSGTPMSILTKGTLLRRDLQLLRQAAGEVSVDVSVSLAFTSSDEASRVLQKQIEPGTPTAAARLELIRAIADAGFAPQVMVAPVIPYLTDGSAQLDALLGELASAGAAGVTAFPMHLRGSTRDWFLSWVAQEHPALLKKYRSLYGRSAYVTPEYSAWLRERMAPLVAKHGLTGTRRVRGGSADAAPMEGPAPTLTLF